MSKSGSEGRGEQTTARKRGIGGSPLTLPPCGTPSSNAVQDPFSMTPAANHF